MNLSRRNTHKQKQIKIIVLHCGNSKFEYSTLQKKKQLPKIYIKIDINNITQTFDTIRAQFLSIIY